MNDEHHFYQEMRDFFRIEAQRYTNIMTSNQDLMDAIAALPVAGISTALTDLDTTIKAAITDMGTGGDTARAAMLAALGVVSTGLASVAAQIVTLKTELTDAIAAQTPAPLPPAA
jgi:hypothetical protein